jgi:hypothetical protein
MISTTIDPSCHSYFFEEFAICADSRNAQIRAAQIHTD